jgi:hypothetical protein
MACVVLWDSPKVCPPLVAVRPVFGSDALFAVVQPGDWTTVSKGPKARGVSEPQGEPRLSHAPKNAPPVLILDFGNGQESETV